MIARRPGLVLLFAAAQYLSNLLRLWIGAADRGQDGGSLFVIAAGGLFLFVRLCLTQWLHVAAARLAGDGAVSAWSAFRIGRTQALWFHGMVLVSAVAFAVRLWLGQYSGGFFAPNGLAGVSAMVSTFVGLLVTYLIFLPFQPGFMAALLCPTVPTAGWSFAGIRGQMASALAALMLVACPIAFGRLGLFSLIGVDTLATTLVTGALDALLTAVIMLLATSIYYRTYRVALERLGPPEPAEQASRA